MLHIDCRGAKVVDAVFAVVLRRGVLTCQVAGSALVVQCIWLETHVGKRSPVVSQIADVFEHLSDMDGRSTGLGEHHRLQLGLSRWGSRHQPP